MKRRVLILGGGTGGMAAAWALSQTAAQRERFDVTVVQPGWRLGGKGATGRDSTMADAVLEHGLHIWLGFYRRAFTMIADVYGAWKGPRRGPQRSLRSAFTPQYDVTLLGGTNPDERWRLRFPRTGGVPWDGGFGLRSSSALSMSWIRHLPSALVRQPGEGGARKRIAHLVSVAATVGRGLARERARHGEGMWDAMDTLELRAWLRSHGGGDAVCRSPVVTGLYDLGFAYPSGRSGVEDGEAAAGVAIRVLLKMFGGYRGAPLWRMTAGMGDTIFAPMYEVLRARGVAFRFFERVERLTVCNGGVEAIDLAQQATGVEHYDPLVEVGDVRAWPSEPVRARVGELVSGDLEADRSASLGTRTLQREADFDDVVLAVPPPAQPLFAQSLLAASPRYRAMVEHITGVPTIAAQLWLERTPAQLGWRGSVGVLTGAPGLFRTCADMTEVADAERWPHRPSWVAYLCGVAPPELAALERSAADTMASTHAREWLRDALWLCPNASLDGRFDAAALMGGDSPESIYGRCNTYRWEQYILSRPGATQYRLAPDDSGFDNLFLAGDWTRNCINGGSVEGAVDSGMLAAAAIMRGSAHEP